MELKDGRKGLGHASEIKRLRHEAAGMRQEMIRRRNKLHDQFQQDFRSRQRLAQMEKDTERDLGKSQRVCVELDTKEVIVFFKIFFVFFSHICALLGEIGNEVCVSLVSNIVNMCHEAQ